MLGEIMTSVSARHFETLQPITIQIEDDRIAKISAAADAPTLPYVSTGFFDIQINGYDGRWFCSPDLTVEDVSHVARALLERGITRFFPTLITAGFDALEHGFRTLQRATEEDPLVDVTVAGYHLEGPYISAEDGPRGAHPLQHVRDADIAEFDRLQAAAGGRIRLLTLAAESPGAPELIRHCRESGVVVSLGHMAAASEQIAAAVEAGAQLSTHLGNGAHGQLRRHPNYLWDQLAEDRLTASVIADGWHLPPAVLNSFLRCKTFDRLVLTCDVSGFGGCAPGVYAEGDVGVEVLEDGRIVVAGQRQFLAGSGATTGDCVVHMASATDLTLAESVHLATTAPARLFGEQLPQVAEGEAATFTLFRVSDDSSSFLPVQTYLNGQPVNAAN